MCPDEEGPVVGVQTWLVEGALLSRLFLLILIIEVAVSVSDGLATHVAHVGTALAGDVIAPGLFDKHLSTTTVFIFCAIL